MNPELLTALVLCGGRAQRMGGQDKGLIVLKDKPLVHWVLDRLAPQVSKILINANRSSEQYATFGYPVIADAFEGFEGPLAGFYTGLTQCNSPYLVVVPCDSPLLPNNLVEQLFQSIDNTSFQLAYACVKEQGGRENAIPVFCILRKEVITSLKDFLDTGQRKIDRWFATLPHTKVVFEDERAFANINTPEELEILTQQLS